MGQIRQGLLLKQQQKLYMTTELKQAISVLQMTTLELCDYIAHSMEENPFLEAEEGDYAEAYPNQVNMETVLDQQERNLHVSGEAPEVKEEHPFERYLSVQPTLSDHLLSQLSFELSEQVDIFIGSYLIGNIDRNGYLCTDVPEVAARLDVVPERVAAVLKVIQGFHPAGVAARSLKECLLLQLGDVTDRKELAVRVIENYLEDLAAHKIGKIARALGVNATDIQYVNDLIRTLDPKPGLQFETEKSPAIWPDVSVVKESGHYVVYMQDYDFPPLRINQHYATLFRQEALGAEARKYLEEKLGAALGLIRGIEQRRHNIYRVTQCIVEEQEAFLECGISRLKPLTMSHVAEMVGIHESTVSRVVGSKYVQTPQGLFELKFFFHSGLPQAGENMSSRSVKHMIQELIAAESSAAPLSDAEIMESLHGKGIEISRRTVNKYRQSLGIPANNLRKRFSAS
jgi:RNA polymerase sigma-54 factor